MLKKECNCRCCNDKIWQFQAPNRAYKMQPWNSVRVKTRLKERGEKKDCTLRGGSRTVSCADH